MREAAIPAEAGWREALALPAFRRRLLATVPALVVTLALLATFVKRVERRPGATLADPVLALVAPRDVTWLTFGFIYVGILLAVALLARRPVRLLLGVQAYVVMALLRMAVMWVTPLDPPPGMITLEDPLVQVLGGASQPLTRDLFFSGHTSTMFLLFLAVPDRRARVFYLAATVGVALLVLVQHVHYTVDVLVAPPFAFAAWTLARLGWPLAPSVPGVATGSRAE